MTAKRFLLIAGVLCGLAATSGCSSGGAVPDDAAEPQLALRGLDPVLLVQGQERAGREDLSATRGRFRYLFATEETLARFERVPERFQIQLEGQCARMQGGVPGDPDVFTVYQHRIYVFESRNCLQAFEIDPEGYLETPPVAPATSRMAVARPISDDTPVTQSRRGTTSSAAEDWPQWGGPYRNFKSAATGLAQAWPPQGPVRLWERDLGEGFSSISVERGRLFTMYRRGGQEVVVALDAATGKTLWEYSYDAPFTNEYNVEFGPGPHATPLVAGDLVFTVGATAKLHALDKRSGRPVWRHDLIAEFGGTLRNRGYASSPLAYADTVIVTVGGEGTSLMAFARKDGSVVWKSQSFRNSQSSPIVIDVEGEDQLVAVMAEEVVAVDPADGRLLWTHDHATDWGLNVSTPVWGADGRLFVSSAYNGGSRLIRVGGRGSRPPVAEEWFTSKMRIHFGNAVRLESFVFGSSGDFGPSFFVALDLESGELTWRERSIAKASFVYADGRFIILDENGQLLLATPTTTGLRIHSRTDLLSRVAWTVPALAGTTLYVRDREVILALDLR